MAFLEAQKLVKEYKRRGKSFRAVDDIDFSINPGEFVMIEGESGSGKTTFLNLITGLTDPMGFIFQFYNLVPNLTVRENILFPFTIGGTKRPSNERLLEVAGKLGIAELLDEYPSELSGGEMRRATIARAVINKPSLIIADEPTGSLDSANTSKVMDIFREIAAEGTAVIVVTHQKETLGYASRVLGMSKGRFASAI